MQTCTILFTTSSHSCHTCLAFVLKSQFPDLFQKYINISRLSDFLLPSPVFRIVFLPIFDRLTQSTHLKVNSELIFSHEP